LNFHSDQKTVQDFIRTGDVEGAIQFLDQLELSSSTRQQLILIEAEYNELKRAENKGVITQQDAQLRRNQINDRLLQLVADRNVVDEPSPNSGRWLLIGVGVLLLSLSFWYFTSNTSPKSCLDFPEDVENRIVVAPFENVGSTPAKPHIVLRDRINQLALNNQLSSLAKLFEEERTWNLNEIEMMTKECDSNVYIWGTYSNRSDSIRLILNYYFTDEPDLAQIGTPIALKDVTVLQSGKMLKGLDDAILSLCGLIALRDGDRPLAKKWFQKVEQKEALDRDILTQLN